MRLRLKQAGLPKPSRVFMVSAVNGFGVKDMVRTIKEEMGFRADLWVVGAQNGEWRGELHQCVLETRGRAGTNGFGQSSQGGNVLGFRSIMTYS